MKYLIDFTATYSGQVQVEADNEEEAREIAKDFLAGSGAAFESDDTADLDLIVSEAG